MKNQDFEREFFTNLAQELINISNSNGIRWEKLILLLQYTVTESIIWDAKYSIENREKVLPSPLFSSEEIRKFKKYTEENNYTPWNRFRFELTPDHKFNISFEWDQALDDEYRQYL